jgi:hypothetical protein
VLRTVAALYIDPRGPYPKMPGVECWDEARDARLYDGPHPVVAHPPCQRWCRLAGLVEARWGHKRGEDGGCFASALSNVRRCGGVLEHPAYSDAWKAYDLPRPGRQGGWSAPDSHGGRSCQLEQSRYGHRAKKATWLYAVGAFPELAWGYSPDRKSEALISWCGNHVRSGESRPRLGKFEAKATPPEFAEMLVALARASLVPNSPDVQPDRT